MTAVTEERAPARSTGDERGSRFLVPEMWVTVCIVTMWLAVLVVGVWGGDMTFRNVDSSSSVVPAVTVVALFAAIGTGSVAKRVFGRRADKGPG